MHLLLIAEMLSLHKYESLGLCFCLFCFELCFVLEIQRTKGRDRRFILVKHMTTNNTTTSVSHGFQVTFHLKICSDQWLVFSVFSGRHLIKQLAHHQCRFHHQWPSDELANRKASFLVWTAFAVDANNTNYVQQENKHVSLFHFRIQWQLPFFDSP